MDASPALLRALSGSASGVATQERLHRLSLRWLRIIGISLMVLAIIAIGMVFSAARAVVMPLVAGIVMGLILGPIGDRGKAFGFPVGLTHGLSVLALLGGFTLVGAALLPTFDTLSEAIPLIKDRLASLSSRVEGWFGGAPWLHQAPGAPGVDQATALEWAGKAFSVLTPALSQTLIFLFTLVLFLAGRSDIRRSITLAVKTREKRLAALRTLTNIENRLTDYFLLVGGINLALAALVGLVFVALDVPGAGRWAMAIFVLNFLPVVGPLLIKLALLCYAMLFAPGLASGLAPLFIFAALSLMEANIVTPRLVGARMTLNPLLVFISVVVWTWLWGFPGAFLAMPFLAIASAIHAEHGTARGPVLPG